MSRLDQINMYVKNREVVAALLSTKGEIFFFYGNVLFSIYILK